MIIDTHSHVYLEQFKEDLEDVIYRANEKDVQKILLPNIDMGTTASMLELCENYPDVFFPMMGLHPCSVATDSMSDELEHVEKELEKGNYIAVGEIGIDLYWDKTTLEIQQVAFRKQINLALQYDLPIVIHARDSFEEIFDILNEFDHSILKGVFHCFTGGESEMNHILNSYPGFYLGLGGVSTFKNSGMDKVIPLIPFEKIVFETDAPYLAPVPNRGKRNEPSYIVDVAQKVADLKEVSLDRVKEISTINAVSLFKLQNILS